MQNSPVINKSRSRAKFRFSLRAKLILLSSVLLTVPWFGYQYVWEMEKYLRYGQEQTLIGTARALATALHERPNLFNNQASFLPSVEQGKDLYGYQFHDAILLDGLANDWPNFSERAHFYGENNQILAKPLSETKPNTQITAIDKPSQQTDALNADNKNTGVDLGAKFPKQPLALNELSLHYKASIAKFDKYLYLMFQVTDNKLIYRGKNALSIVNNDHVELALEDEFGKFTRYIISNKKPGWIDGYRITDIDGKYPAVSPELQGHWLPTEYGYNVEIRLPLELLGDRLAFIVHDVDESGAQPIASIGSSDTRQVDTLGTVLVPSPEIERIVEGMSYTNSRIWVVDHHHRVLATAGNLKNASGVWQMPNNGQDQQSSWQGFIEKYLHPLYYKILTKPSKDFIDQLYDASHLGGDHIESALDGKTQSQWRLTKDQKAVVLSAAYPIFIGKQVKGAVIVEETTNGIRTVRNRALERLFSVILAILVIGSLVFFVFASRISGRIVSLRNQAESAIDTQGRIKHEIAPSNANDEIGDLSRSFSSVVMRLSQYNHYLENMSARLSHELRTPIAVVRTSLENLSMQQVDNNAQQYLDRAQSGILRLNDIITRMSEATRIEQSLHTTEPQVFDFHHVLSSCLVGYQQIHSTVTFENALREGSAFVNGSPDHIAQLLDKVITNAVEFSDDKHIYISFTEHKGNWLLTIRNYGQILPQDMADKLFDSMVSVRKESKSETPHLGLGLYIARLIVQFHQGNISAYNVQKPQHSSAVSSEYTGVEIAITMPIAKVKT